MLDTLKKFDRVDMDLDAVLASSELSERDKDFIRRRRGGMTSYLRKEGEKFVFGLATGTTPGQMQPITISRELAEQVVKEYAY